MTHDHFTHGRQIDLHHMPLHLAAAMLGEKVALALLAVTSPASAVRARVKSVCRARREVVIEYEEEPREAARASTYPEWKETNYDASGKLPPPEAVDAFIERVKNNTGRCIEGPRGPNWR